MSLPRIIALSGLEGSGKNTIGTKLQEDWDYYPVSFAHVIKVMGKLAFPKISDELLWGPSKLREQEIEAYPLRGVSPSDGDPMHFNEGDNMWVATSWGDSGSYPKHLTARLVAQTLGSWGRRLYEAVWVEALLDGIEDPDWCKQVGYLPLVSGDRPVVITDLRFWNELRAVQARGGKAVRLLRGFEEAKNEASSEASKIHQSVREQFTIPHSKFDYVLSNTGPLKTTLDTLVPEMVESLRS